jgi:hypothetical protein
MKHTIFFINSIDLGKKKYYFIKKEAVYSPARNSVFFKIGLKNLVPNRKAFFGTAFILKNP